MEWYNAANFDGFDMIFDDATRAQISAARPDASTWLTANAGSGKTRVLTDRVARLLLDQVAPEHILCLTYTKAAASEMQNRLFKRLGEWAMLDDANLRQALTELGIPDKLDSQSLRRARTLFALAIEAPGGLKIQTIHSFCASLLRRFPLEAGVSPQFTEIEDRAADLLRADIVDEIADGPNAHLVSDLAGFYTGDDFPSLTRQIVSLRDSFNDEPQIPDLLEKLGQPRELTEQDIASQVFEGDIKAMIARILPHLIAKGATDGKAAARLSQIRSYDFSALPVLEGVLLTGGSAAAPFSAKIGSFPTKATREKIGADLPLLETLMKGVEEAREARLALDTARKTYALHQFAVAFLDQYENAKQQRGWLDFDDLILRARALLSDRAVASWVLYRIDGGIDHILVDEAQDTSPRQWDVIEKLTDEFHSGAGARSDVARTLFVVGDKKQSIYSFQGADPLEFDRKSHAFETKIRGVGEAFQRNSLDYSFRSSSAILRFVDTVFDPRRLSGFDKETMHRAFKEDLPGRVDLWPVVPPAEKEEDRTWTDPIDRRSAHHHTVILAEKIATRIAELTRGEHYLPDEGPTPGTFINRRVQPGDFLILVQRRSALFSEIIRACKAAGLPIAGADRLKVGAELAVKDLGALLSFLATPDDNLSLATALKSPLFGWAEQDLFDLAHKRTETNLWQALRGRKDHIHTVNILRDLRAQVDFLRPYDLIERILTRHDGRRKLLARLGPEAEDGINAMLNQALSYERGTIPSLTQFVEWMLTDELEIKRQIDTASNQIRVMTVHGAKGLEAPIVVLPDTGRRDITIKDDIVRLDGLPMWKPASDDMPAILRESVADIKESQFKERLRLFYVAITRAEKWLIIAAAGDLPKDSSSWYQAASLAMDHINGVPVGDDGTLRFQEGNWDALARLDVNEKTVSSSNLETVFSKSAPVFSVGNMVLSPSDLGGEKVLASAPSDARDDAKKYGSLVHALLEILSERGAGTMPEMTHPIFVGFDLETCKTAIEEARAILRTPALAHIFGSNTMSEVPITGSLGGQRLHGIIDRLLFSSSKVTVFDFKTNYMVPETAAACPEGILRQMGAYVEMLSAIYPDHQVEAAIVWTKNCRLMPLPGKIMHAALERSPYLDLGRSRS